MIDLLAKLIGLIASLASSAMAWAFAREHARAEALNALVEKQNAIRKAGELGPHTVDDAVERLRKGTF